MSEVIGSSLSTLTAKVRRLIPGLSTTGSNSDAAIMNALNAVIERMSTDYLWPFLRVKSELEFVDAKAAPPSDYYSYSSLKNDEGVRWTMVDPEEYDLGSGNIFTREPDSNLSRTISTAVLASNVVTVTTTAAHGFAEGDTIDQAGVGSATFVDTDIEIASVPSTTTYTYALVAADESSTGGTVTRQRKDKFHIKGITDDTLILRYYRLITAMSADANLSGLPTYLEEAAVEAAIAFQKKRNNAKNDKVFWDAEFRKIMDPIFNRLTDDEQDNDIFLTDYDDSQIVSPPQII